MGAGITVKMQVDHMKENGEPLLPNSYRSSNINIIANRLQDVRSNGIELSNLKDSIIRDNNISSVDFSAIYVAYCDDLLIYKNIGNKIYWNSFEGSFKYEKVHTGGNKNTGEWANYSNLDKLINGYGYWIKGDIGVSFEVKR